ncbi:MAG TPA: ZIP family metal transporter [Candidatus Nanoarchaeia archaeon]|nr:ZIP family metal transporter [Candidatus Nanoarchaeia archaeon]
MAYEIAYTLLSVLAISALSLIGAATLSWRKEVFEHVLTMLVGFAAGAMLSVVFFDLLHEAEEIESGMAIVLGGIVLFFIIERFIHWHHCHDQACELGTQAVGYLNLIGDAVHNFIDGAIIAAAYLSDAGLGFVATIAIAAHEIPQEIGDFGILVHSGFSRRKALLFNFFSALSAVAGAFVAIWAASAVSGLIPFLVALAAGGFIYIAVADLLPELHKETSSRKVVMQLLFFLIGIVAIWAIIRIVPHVE